MNAFNEVMAKNVQALKAATGQESTKFLLAFPEDLGVGKRGHPASLWQDTTVREMVTGCGGTTAAYHSCDFGGQSTKPMRTASNLDGHAELGLVGWPQFDEEGHYKGPLPKACKHGGHEALKGKVKETHKTARAAVNEGLQEAWANLAAANLEDDSGSLPSASKLKGNTDASKDLKEEGKLEKADTGVTRTVKGIDRKCEKAERKAEPEEATSSEDEDGEKRPKLGAGLWGEGPPLKVLVRGKISSFRDGGGLCSPGRWLPEDRQLDKSATAQSVRMRLMQVLTKHEDFGKPPSTLLCFTFSFPRFLVF
mgnify:CR=1 FL=1